MKKLLLIIFLSPIYLFAQEKGPYNHLKLENNQVVFQEVYQYDSLSAQKIKQALAAYVPTIKGLKDYQLEGDVITGVVAGYIDYKKYGGKWGSTATFMNHPFTANVNFIWKDGRYRATATNIVFHTAGFGDMDATMIFAKGKKVKVWDDRQIIIKAGEYIEQYLNELFTVKQSNNW